MAQDAKKYEGSCFCGAVQFTVTGAPVAQGYCHCTSCRHWSAGPINAFSLWSPDSVKILKGADKIGTYHKTERSYRKYCTACGGHLMTDHPAWKLVDVYAAVIPSFSFQPQVHVHYQEKVTPMQHGLPKFKHIPKEMGGPGQTLAE